MNTYYERHAQRKATDAESVQALEEKRDELMRQVCSAPVASRLPWRRMHDDGPAHPTNCPGTNRD
jgi:hypothetical protein